MLTMIICSVIFASLMVYAARRFKWDFDGWRDYPEKPKIDGYDWGMAALGICVGALISLPLSIVVLYSVNPEKIEVETKIEIKGLKDNITSSGDFFLGAGEVEGNNYYYFMKKDEYGYKMSKVEAEEVSLNETNSESPGLVTVTPVLKNESWYKWVVGLHNRMSKKSEQYLIVPEGTITKDFKVDLE